ncbi:MAG: hypothetical protein SF172_08190 [Burkholderiales bacterium]|nr:hypothetical protein [Burkholderiales bacterium]
MDFLSLFTAPQALVQAWPAAPFLLAAAFALAQLALIVFRQHRPAMILWRRPALFAAAIWVVYGLYELQVQATQLYANIRIDLLVLAPILYVFSAVGVWWVAREWRGPQRPQAEAPTGDAGTAADENIGDR